MLTVIEGSAYPSIAAYLVRRGIQCLRCHAESKEHWPHQVRFTPVTRITRAFRAIPSWPSRPGEFHPEPLTDPDLTLSRHPARATARRLPPSIEYRVPPVAG